MRGTGEVGDRLWLDAATDKLCKWFSECDPRTNSRDPALHLFAYASHQNPLSFRLTAAKSFHFTARSFLLRFKLLQWACLVWNGSHDSPAVPNDECQRKSPYNTGHTSCLFFCQSSVRQTGLIKKIIKTRSKEEELCFALVMSSRQRPSWSRLNSVTKCKQSETLAGVSHGATARWLNVFPITHQQ